MFSEKFNIEKNSVIVITGAGGKTSLLFTLAEELSKKGRVLVTTTTKIYEPLVEQYETLIIGKKIFQGRGRGITVMGEEKITNKLTALSYEKIESLKKDYEYILIEGDGAKEKLLKKWSEYEPCIPPFADVVIGVINSNILGMEINEENIHRFHLLEGDHPSYIDSSFLAKYLKGAEYFKGASNSAKKYLFFNGIDGERKIEYFRFALEVIKKANLPWKIVMGSIREGECYSYQKVDGVVMASGFSKRMGRDKLKLKIDGVSLLEITMKKLASISFNEILICGRDSWVEELSKKYSFKYLYNSLAHLGQSVSIKLGVKNSYGEGIVFFTGDQPFLSEEIILNLYLEFLKSNLITIPIVSGKRFSPVFFPKGKKLELLKLEGDVGGRVVIKNTPLLNLVEFSNKEKFIDIDTSEDYNGALLQTSLKG